MQVLLLDPVYLRSSPFFLTVLLLYQAVKMKNKKLTLFKMCFLYVKVSGMWIVFTLFLKALLLLPYEELV